MKTRGEVSVKIKGQEHKMLIDLGTMAEIELDLGIVSFDQAMAMMGEGSIRAMISILTQAAKRTGDPIPPDVISDLSLKELEAALKPVMKAMGEKMYEKSQSEDTSNNGKKTRADAAASAESTRGKTGNGRRPRGKTGKK